MDTVVRAVSTAVLAVLVGFKSLQGLPCAPAPATTRRGMLVTRLMVRAGVQVRAVIRVVRPSTARTTIYTVSKERFRHNH